MPQVSELKQEWVSQTRSPVGYRRLQMRLSDVSLYGCDVSVHRIQRWEGPIFVRILNLAEDVLSLNVTQ